MILQLNPPIPIWNAEHGKGQAIGWIDYSSEHHLMWICAFDDTGQVWTLDNTQVRLQRNISMGRMV